MDINAIPNIDNRTHSVLAIFVGFLLDSEAKRVCHFRVTFIPYVTVTARDDSRWLGDYDTPIILSTS